MYIPKVNKIIESLHTWKVEFVRRIKTEPSPCRKKRLCHKRNSAGTRRLMSWSIRRLKNLTLLMNNTMHRRCWRRRRSSSMNCLPKWHATKPPNFSIRPSFLTLHLHSYCKIGLQATGYLNWWQSFKLLFVLLLKIDLALVVYLLDTFSGLSLFMKAP